MIGTEVKGIPVLISLLFLFCDCAHAQPDEDLQLILQPQNTAQTIDGFGASGAWWAQIVGGWTGPERTRIVKLLFGKVGIGLSIYRYNIGAGSKDDIRDPWRGAETFEVGPGQYDWSRDASAVRVVKEACAQGVKHVILFANSPPKRMTKSGYAYGREKAGRSNLREEMYDAYATYMVDVAGHFIDAEGIPVRGISPINEPNWAWDGSSQEGCHYEPEEAARLVEILLRKIEKRSLNVEVDTLEVGSWERVEELGGTDWHKSPVYVDTIFRNPYILRNLGSYAVHSYWAERKHKKAFAQYFMKTYPGKKLHMTEWCEMKSGRDFGMDSALTLANEIVDDFVEGGVSSWQYWVAVSRYNFRDGLIYVDEEPRAIHPTKRLWAMGNFSRFIRPGFQRFAVVSGSPVLRALACKDRDSGVLVVVVVNNAEKRQTAKLRLPGARGQRRLHSFETSGKNDLKQICSNAVQGSYTFPPRSITTLVFERNRK